MRLRETILAVALAVLAAACPPYAGGPANPALVDASSKGDALAISDALEELVAAGKDTPSDRQFALDVIRAHPENTAAYAFARAAVTGRVVQSRGLTGAPLVAEMEHWAEISRKLDPQFREGAATRALGTLYVMAPSGWLEHGDSEQGLEMLEALVKAHPHTLENQLRLAEAYIALGDAAPAQPYLCACQARKADLRRDDQLLLAHLFADAGNVRCPGLDGGSATKPPGPKP